MVCDEYAIQTAMLITTFAPRGPMLSTFSIPENLAETAPFYIAPTGPVWRVRGAAIRGDSERHGHDFLLRRLPLGKSMLRISPLLAEISRVDHPNMWGPSYWKKDGDMVWIASQMPPGKLLGCDHVEHPDAWRLSWAQALELWRPIAESTARLHRRGLVHGSIAPWNTWLDASNAELSTLDAGCWIGDDFAALTGGPHAEWIAPELRCEVAMRHATPASDIYGLARLLLRLLLTPDQARAMRPSFTGLPAFAIPALNNALHEDPTRRPGRVADLITATVPQPFYTGAPAEPADAEAEPAAPVNSVEAELERGATTISLLHARVSEIELLEHPKLGAGIKFYMTRDEGRIGAFFYQKQTPEVFESVKWVWEGCELNLLDARVITNSAGEPFLTGQENTLPVLEPHMPMSVSDVLKAEGCTSRFLVDQRSRGPSSRPLVFGNLVHGLLDDLVEPNPPDFDTAYQTRVAELRLDMLAAGLQDSDLKELYEDARQHFANIERFTSKRTANSSDEDRVGWSGRNVEVTRYSTRYGIEGRVDLVSQDPRDGLQIIELKTGRAWDGHFSQLQFYRFLWEGLAEERDLEITGHLLYSRFSNLKAAPMQDTARERRILRARNELIACLRSFVDPNYSYDVPYFMQNPRACNSAGCKFRRDRCEQQTSVLGLAHRQQAYSTQGDAQYAVDTLETRAWAWHRHFVRLIEMERWAATVKLGAVLHPARLEERKKNYDAIDNLELVAAYPEFGSIAFRHKPNGEDDPRIFRPGDYVLAHRGDFNTSHILRGRVVSVERDASHTDTQITMSTRGAPIASELLGDGWILDKLPARIGFSQAHHALYAALERSSAERRTILFKPESAQAQKLLSETDPRFRPDAKTAQLNPSQQQAVARAVSTAGGALIQGPPGTGKTTVIAHAVRELVARGKKVLLSAFTNTAVDTILLKLLEIGFDDFVRVGGIEKSPDLARKLRDSGRTPSRFFTTEMAEEIVSLDLLADDLLNANVIASTAHRCANSPMMSFLREQRGDLPFDVAIVDEAGQITEPMTLAAINLGARFVLVGDHRQLPPIVENEQAHSNFVAEMRPKDLPAADARDLETLGCAGLNQSLFERLITRLPYVMLDEQYRMHAQIMAFSNAAFYGGNLRAHTSVSARQIAFDTLAATPDRDATQQLLQPDYALLFVNVDPVADQLSDTGNRDIPLLTKRHNSRHNESEAEAIIETVEAMLKAMPAAGEDTANPLSIGIVSPFRAQVQLLRNLLTERIPDDAGRIDVDTVERFQGSERDIILVSLVKTGRAGDFLADERRLNVTLTRARQKLVVFGSHACLALNPMYRSLIEQPETYFVNWSR
ncbi:DNA replication ATP-dependent helicase Dna2 [Bradymonas sediminis]|uniref:Uncharacterized protein n=2 Tax=Bradymonas sediminis TaxID=1548548 RepID=A0A2Z4FGS3_9DELT|nr:hypothetical protein DN745_00655 [Bradymonas sediminis]TDP62933.1 DNA replication ATP-dependent helicase Dna2 [Bradymonas sediminis]